MKAGTTTRDFVIIGSGFGGSVSAMRLTEKGYNVLVLERGKRYNAEDFPETNWNLPKYLWLPAARCFGIMGINFLNDIMILNGSGVGGGSLVYASTHIKPSKRFFDDPQWRDLADWETELEPHYETANRMLGTAPNPRLWPADHILKEIADEMGQGHTFKPTPVGIFFGEEGKTVPDPFFNGEGPDRAGCVHCGGCMVGCRHNAKNTLDRNYLYLAEKWGAEVRPEANVVDVRPLYGPQPDGARYEVVYEKTTAWFVKPRTAVRTRNVIFSAGVLGTVNLLLQLKNETHSLPNISDQLGEVVRSNSEALMGVTARVGDEARDFSQGVAITSHFWVDEVTSVEPVRYPRGSSLMRNLSVPLINLDGGLGNRLWQFAKYTVSQPYDFLKARFLPDWARDSTILLIMQTVDNRMKLMRGRNVWTAFRKGLVSEMDHTKGIPAVIDAGRKVVNMFAQKTDGIPASTVNEVVLNLASTAHILGGCGIGADETKGVIDTKHEMFNYPGIFVADGSVIPANLGVNPSLTITAMTERAMSLMPEKGEAEQPQPLYQPSAVTMHKPDSPVPAIARTAVSVALFTAVVAILAILLNKK